MGRSVLRSRIDSLQAGNRLSMRQYLAFRCCFQEAPCYATVRGHLRYVRSRICRWSSSHEEAHTASARRRRLSGAIALALFPFFVDFAFLSASFSADLSAEAFTDGAPAAPSFREK